MLTEKIAQYLQVHEMPINLHVITAIEATNVHAVASSSGMNVGIADLRKCMLACAVMTTQAQLHCNSSTMPLACNHCVQCNENLIWCSSDGNMYKAGNGCRGGSGTVVHVTIVFKVATRSLTQTNSTLYYWIHILEALGMHTC